MEATQSAVRSSASGQWVGGLASDVPQILHAIPGRIRVHLPAWSGHGQYLLEHRLREIPGVWRVDANSLTHNVLIIFDAEAVKRAALLTALREAQQEAETAAEEDQPPPPVVEEQQDGPIHRARIAVRGLDRDPKVARRVLQRLQKYRGVRAWASMLTGRVLVEYSEYEAPLKELLAEVTRVELPPLPGEDRPAHPLDPAPLWQSISRTVGAGLGLTM